MIGFMPIGAEEDISEYEIEYVYKGGEGEGLLGGDTQKRVYAINFYLEGVKVEGVRSSSNTCLTGSENTASCNISQIIQNEVIIKQNYIMIDQNQQIIELLTPKPLTIEQVLEGDEEFDWRTR